MPKRYGKATRAALKRVNSEHKTPSGVDVMQDLMAAIYDKKNPHLFSREAALRALLNAPKGEPLELERSRETLRVVGFGDK